ncbi:MAG TPA: decarboxylating 6-phosphogluconate dehydrogenase [Actinomycetota bacterium]|nr:decarboxylating 6-phosphogluconate dehydrogenase [Actinomycetota bacterium]
MKLGMVGLGRMGGNMTTRLLRGGHEVVGFAIDAASVELAVADGAAGASSLEELVSKLEPPRLVWLMVPSGAPTQSTIVKLNDLLATGDIVVDGGNSKYTDSIARAELLAENGISFVDAGTSGGIWGLEEGYCLMVGCTQETFARIEPILATLAPEHGYARVGASGAGHFTKMVHNGIEYGLMQAYGEGFELLQKSRFDLDLPQIAELWQHGSVVRSWLLDLAAKALAEDPRLEKVSDYVEDSGEGRWTIETALEQAVPTPAIALALFARFASRQDESFSNKLLAALRKEFGGHAIHDKKP